jgi:molybdopterin molybdotransferase
MAPPGAAGVVALVRQCGAPLPAVRVSLAEALGGILREPVCATEDQPAFDRSVMDGYAILRDDPSASFRLVDEIRAGEWKPRTLRLGETVRVATGAALPGTGLQVVMREQARVEAAQVWLAERGEETNIRPQGQDAARGEVLVPSGTVLRPGTLALLASLGHAHPLVTRPLRVLHVATGNELVAPDQKPGPGQIRDSNSTLVRAFFQVRGLALSQCRLPEDEGVAQETLRGASESVDLLLISGGASVGEHDFTRRLLEYLGYGIRLQKTNTRPGKPLVFGTRGPALAFGLPGNPLAHFVCLHLYVRAALEALRGGAETPLFQTGRLAIELVSDGHDRETFWPAVCQRSAGPAELIPLRWASSGDLTPLATATALLRVTGGTTRLERGESIEFVDTECG